MTSWSVKRFLNVFLKSCYSEVLNSDAKYVNFLSVVNITLDFQMLKFEIKPFMCMIISVEI